MKKLLFQKTTVRMTGMYLLVLMAVSLLFSLSLYRVLGTEIDRTYVRSVDFADRFGGFRPNPLQRIEFMEERLAERNSSKDKLVGQLVFINIAVLGAGGILSYGLARRTLKPIEEAHEALERFTSDASHELRTPLTTMRTEIEVALMNDKLNIKDAKLLLQSNLEEVDRLTHLSERLLLLAKLEEDGLPKERTDILDVALKAAGIAATTAQVKDITLVKKLPKKGSAYALVDEASLTELLVILLDNAVKYSPTKTKVTLTATIKAKHIQLSVIDQGIGITPDHLPHIFDRFYRADSSRTGGEGHGYGLGLALAQKIAQLHDTTITVVSEPDKGSTFTVVLPTA